MIRRALTAGRRARFVLWVALLRARLRRHGVRLALETPHGVRLDAFPPVAIVPRGRGGTVALRFGADVSLGPGPTFELWTGTDSRLHCGDGVSFMAGTHVQLRGGTIELGRHTHVRTGSVLKVTDGELTVGERVLVSWHVVLACSERIEIGDTAGLGERLSIVDSDHGVDGSDTPWQDQPLATSPVTLGDNVLVSANATILRGVTIGPNAVIAANAVLPAGDYPAGWLIAGLPAEPVRALPAAEPAAAPLG